VSNPLYTADQEAAEKLALRLIERGDVRMAREVARQGMLVDAAAKTLDGSLGLDASHARGERRSGRSQGRLECF
jgi:hypothetical protein